jgi:hypothetical protein
MKLIEIARHHLIWLMLVAATGCGGPMESNDGVIWDIRTVEELDAALTASRAVIHVDVDWAHQAIRSRPTVRKLAESAGRHEHLSDVPFYRLGVSEQEGPVWDAFTVWQGREHSDPTLGFGGGGAVIWIENGRQKDAVLNAYAVGESGLLDRTLAAFGD